MREFHSHSDVGSTETIPSFPNLCLVPAHSLNSSAGTKTKIKEMRYHPKRDDQTLLFLLLILGARTLSDHPLDGNLFHFLRFDPIQRIPVGQTLDNGKDILSGSRNAASAIKRKR